MTTLNPAPVSASLPPAQAKPPPQPIPPPTPPAKSAPDAADDSLDARIWRVEQRLIAREQRLRVHAQDVTQRVQRGLAFKRYLVPAATAGVAVVTLFGLWRGRRGPARALDRKSTRLNSSHSTLSRMPSSA